jgi:hypothetical protein
MVSTRYAPEAVGWPSAEQAMEELYRVSPKWIISVILSRTWDALTVPWICER